MKATVGVGVLEHAVAFRVHLSGLIRVILTAHLEVVIVDEVVACVIGRIGCLTTFDTITRLFP